MHNEKWNGVLLCILSALLYGLSAVLIKYLSLSGVGVYTILFFRGVLAVLMMGSYLKLRGETLLPDRPAELGLILVHGFGGMALTLLLLNMAYLYLPVGTATTIHYLYPLLVNLAGLFLFHAPFRWSTIAVLAVVMCGIGLLAGQGGALNTIGILLAGASAVTWSFHILCLNYSRLREQPPLRLSFWQAAVAAVVGGSMSLAGKENLLAGVTPYSFLFLVLSTLTSMVFASALLNLGIRRVGASLASIFSVFEPIGSLMFGILLLREFPTAVQWTGTLVILTGITLLFFRSAGQKENL